MDEPTIDEVDGLQCLIDITGLKPLALSDLDGLPLLNVADVERQIMATPTLARGRVPAMSVDGGSDIFSPKTSQRNTQKFLETRKPAQGKNALPPDPPEWIFQTDEGPAGELKQRYSALPARVLSDRRVRGVTLLVLAGLAAHTSRLGITYVGQHRLSALLRITQPMVSRAIKKLVEANYVLKLVPYGAKRPGAWQRGNRYFLRTVPNAPLPPKETVLK
jgi:hypothetical protein